MCATIAFPEISHLKELKTDEHYPEICSCRDPRSDTPPSVYPQLGLVPNRIHLVQEAEKYAELIHLGRRAWIYIKHAEP